jgi:hypothetical protein
MCISVPRLLNSNEAPFIGYLVVTALDVLIVVAGAGLNRLCHVIGVRESV